MPSPGWNRLTKLATKRLILKAIRILGDGDREKARAAIIVNPHTFYLWETGRLIIGWERRRHIEGLIAQKKS